MEFFASNETVAQLEADLGGPVDPVGRITMMLSLAWQLRQRDCARALALCQDVIAQMDGVVLPENECCAIRARIGLVQAEVTWLSGEFDTSLELAQQALQDFASNQSANGCADAHWIRAMIFYYRGEEAPSMAAFQAIIEEQARTDPIRVTCAQAAIGIHDLLRHVGNGRQRWGQTLNIDPHTLAPAVRYWVQEFWGMAANLGSDYVSCIRHYNDSYRAALMSGQIRRAMISASNIGDAFTKLNDYHTALEWIQRSLDLARSNGWAPLAGWALIRSAETLRCLQRYDAAHDLLCEALELMAPIADSRRYANALLPLADVELDRQQYMSALETFLMLEQRALVLRHDHWYANAKRGQAQALLAIGQPDAALTAAHAALAAARGHANDQISVLRVLADIHTRSPEPLPAPENMHAASCALHYLEQAMALAQQIENFIIPGELYDAVAEEHARLGHHQLAWIYSKQAAAARENIHTLEANNRAHAMQVSHQAERAEAESAHQRELASEAKRAEILRQTSETLEHLSAIGQEITAHLDARQVFQTLHHHMHHFFDVTAFAIYLMDEDGEQLHATYAMVDGKLLSPWAVSLEDTAGHSAQCARERREILVNFDPDSGTPLRQMPGTTQICHSMLFAPLILADKVMGVMTIQSTRANAWAFGAREQMIFRALCAYTAIALSNAEAHNKLAQAHRKLQETQQQMVLQGKMAGLGTLTAGVAHEINNPTNFVHVAAQNQRVHIAEFKSWVDGMIEADDAPDILHGFAERFAKLEKGVGTMLNGTDRIKGIVRDLRTFTRLDEAEKKAVRMSECLLSTLNLVRTSWLEKVDFITEFSDDPEIECWPALLNQVFMNLLVNGCQAIAEKMRQEQAANPHLVPTGFDSDTWPQGRLWLRLFCQGPVLVIEFEDNGTGISVADQARIMEPFYTTKDVGKGTGLGLSIAFGIIDKHGGKLTFTSLPGIGSCFTIQLPLKPGSVPSTGQPTRAARTA